MTRLKGIDEANHKVTREGLLLLQEKQQVVQPRQLLAFFFGRVVRID
jgi:hypothetical protein